MERSKMKGTTRRFMTVLLLLSLFMYSCKQGQEHENSHRDDHDGSNEELMEESKASVARQIEELKAAGFEIFDYVDEKTGDTVIMQQYFMAFLNKGPNRNWSKEETDSIQNLHLEHLGRMYELGYADISGPFGGDEDLRGITIYNVPTLQMADSLANMDPAVQAGSLSIEVRPWWAGKGYPLR